MGTNNYGVSEGQITRVMIPKIPESFRIPEGQKVRGVSEGRKDVASTNLLRPRLGIGVSLISEGRKT